jgi:hypothetical protein
MFWKRRKESNRRPGSGPAWVDDADNKSNSETDEFASEDFWVFDDMPVQTETPPVQILTGPFRGCIFVIRDKVIIDEETDPPIFRFGWYIMANPTGVEINEQDPQFTETVGLILQSLIETGRVEYLGQG